MLTKGGVDTGAAGVGRGGGLRAAGNSCCAAAQASWLHTFQFQTATPLSPRNHPPPTHTGSHYAGMAMGSSGDVEAPVMQLASGAGKQR